MKIAICGKMRSGKDTLAEYAIARYGFTRFAFGDGIRKVCKELFPELVVNGAKPRHLYQGVGQDLRKYNPNIWVDTCFREIDQFKNMQVHPIITDLRQPNEYDRCKNEGFVIIKVHTNDDIRLDRMNAKGDKFTMEDLQHETELHIDEFDADYIINNNGTLEEMTDQFDKIVWELINANNRKHK